MSRRKIYKQGYIPADRLIRRKKIKPNTPAGNYDGGSQHNNSDGEMDHNWNPVRPASCQTWSGQHYGIWDVNNSLLNQSNCGIGTSGTWCCGCYPDEGFGISSNANTISGCAPWWVFGCPSNFSCGYYANSDLCIFGPEYCGSHSLGEISPGVDISWDIIDNTSRSVTYNINGGWVDSVGDDCPVSAIATGLSSPYYYDDVEDPWEWWPSGVRCYQVTPIEDGISLPTSTSTYVSQCTDWPGSPLGGSNPLCKACCRDGVCTHEYEEDCEAGREGGNSQADGTTCLPEDCTDTNVCNVCETNVSSYDIHCDTLLPGAPYWQIAYGVYNSDREIVYQWGVDVCPDEGEVSIDIDIDNFAVCQCSFGPGGWSGWEGLYLVIDGQTDLNGDGEPRPDFSGEGLGSCGGSIDDWQSGNIQLCCVCDAIGDACCPSSCLSHYYDGGGDMFSLWGVWASSDNVCV